MTSSREDYQSSVGRLNLINHSENAKYIMIDAFAFFADHKLEMKQL